MGFPRRLLSDGEEIELDLRPHWVVLVWPVVLTAVVLVAATAVVANVPPDWPDFLQRWIPRAAWIAALVVILVSPVRKAARWATSRFVLTNERLIHRSGVLSKRSLELPLERINDVAFRQGILERLVGAGDLVVESGSEYGQSVFTDIPRPEEVQKLIYEMYEDVVGRPLPDPMQPEESPVAVLERLADLKERGHLTDEEFEAQKKKILDAM
ncbi:MAG: PH domain-containing protein [Actinomycetota bacterium]|nr:PH domain-containing protein [Actinomycetota bacterium]